mmetsp:Transcript_40556/g.160866  ORF Transcript_40556/g.160866 Transcript_40556/m.160866 type:complete len:314 (-) Transcript_40556:1418-2359(-)
MGLDGDDSVKMTVLNEDFWKDEYDESYSWRRPLLEAQRKMLTAFSRCQWEGHTVRLSSGEFMNVVVGGKVGNPELVVMHGFGNGLAFWGSNLDALIQSHRVFLLDWIGCAGSSRKQFQLGMSAEETEKFFVEELRDCIRKMKESSGLGFPFQKPFSILGHSLGGFLSCVFAETYPELVKDLVLACPVGIPRAPMNKHPPASAALGKRVLFLVVFFLWRLNFTPQWFMRIGGNLFGKNLALRFVKSRFPDMTEEQTKVMCEYLYWISVPPASGEYAINHILEPGAWARRPLVDRLPKLKIPVSFIYGDKDWMSW